MLGEMKICVIGGGLSGICAAVKLKTKLGVNEFTIFDENEDFGGVWLTHTYPKCACDVSTQIYSFSFVPNPDWTKLFPKQPEVLAYLQSIAKKHDLYKNSRFNRQIQTLTWISKAKQWKVVSLNKETGTTEDWSFDIVIAGPGPFHVPYIPEKFKNFAGPVIHSARWDSSVSLKDKMVAVVGSGSAACQIIPGIVNDVKTLYSFQRRPAWVFYKFQADIPHLARAAVRNVPLLQGSARAVAATLYDVGFQFHSKNSVIHAVGAALCKANILRGVGRLNEKLYKKLVPNYPLGCKRICISNSYYPALARPHVDVIREEVVSVSPEGYISTSDGTTRHVDVIICATGYEQMTTHWFNPVKIFVKEDEIEEGDGIDVTKGLRQDPNFYLGIMTDTLPNMFFIYGPYSLIPHFSAVFCIEYQMNWIVTVLKRMRKMVAGKLERNRDQYQNVVVCVKESAQTDDVRNVRDKMKNTIHGGSVPCNAWNVDKTTGQNLTTFSGAAKDFWWKCRRVRFQDLEFNLTPATHPG